MKSLLFISSLASISLMLANDVMADHKHKHKHKHYHHYERQHVVYDYPEYGRVVAARPIYRTVAIQIPVDSCRVETVAYSERARGGDSFKGTVIGGLVGAAIGHEISHGSGHAAAATGVLGAAIGNDLAKGERITRYEDREVCHNGYRTEYERQLVAYDVSYRYDGRIYHTQTSRHPGSRVAIDSRRSGHEW